MFTFKKIALVGVAGLAAFSMSCSDSGDEDAGGSWTTAFNASYDGDGAFDLTGVVTAAEEGNSVTGITGTVGGVSTDVTGTKTGKSVDLSNLSIGLPTSLCTGKAGTQITVKVEVNVSFTAGASLPGSSNDISLTCPTGGQQQNTPIKTLSVGGESNSLGSFVDLDAGVAYKQSELTANAPKIDIVYGAAYGEKQNWIWSALAFSFEDPIGAALSVNVAFIAPLEKIVGAALATTASTALTTLTSLPSDAMAPFLTALADPGNLEKVIDESIDGFDVTESGAYIVKTTEGDYFIIAVKETNGKTDLKLANLLALDVSN